MEPSSKKRKLAPKVNASAAPNSQPSPYPHETPQPPPPPLPSATTAAATTTAHQQPYPALENPLAERHDFESFARHLQDAAMLIQRQTERAPYADVSVLLLSWHGDCSVHDDLTALEQAFQKHYNFGTQRWQIPAVPNPSIKLGVQMASFLDHARPNHLLIIYYAGYGYVGADGHLYWACNPRDDAAKLKWDGVRCWLEDAQSDILLLLDTCAVPDPPTAGRHGLKQAIAACSPEHKLPDDSTRSFTSILAETLQKLASGRPFSVQRLYEEMLSQRQQQQLAASRMPNGTSNPPPPSQLPIFFTLTPAKGQNLTLAPYPRRDLYPPAASQNSTDAADGHALRGREDQLIDPDSVADLRFDEARILVCTTFVGDASPDMSSFNQWLQNTPPLGSKIAVEGMFLGPPTMLLISMPHSIWNVVQHDKVCCFLGYISSHNMIHLYEKLIGPAGLRPSAKEVEDGRILLEARELAAGTPARVRREPDGHDHHYHPSSASLERSLHGDRPDLLPQGSPSRPPFASAAGPIEKAKNEVEDSAEMQEAAEQLKALSHVRHRSDEALPGAQRPRTSLPDAVPNPGRDNAHAGPHDECQTDGDGSAMVADVKSTPGPRAKAARRSVPKQETRCNHCSHAPFKDSSSLRKHIAAAHTRPFPCAFSFAGCTSTFGSKNEWKRHIASQHLCLQYYRCSQCPQSTVEGKGNEFNRKDLFTQHLRRMHAPFQVKRAMSKGETKLLAEWEEHVKNMQQTCLVTRRQPPQRSACPRPGCQHDFSGPGAWDDWTEHVGRHMEKGEAQSLGVDPQLAQWALDEGIIEPKGGGEYRLCAANGAAGGPATLLERKDSSMLTSLAEASQAEDTPMVDTKPAEAVVGDGPSAG